MLSNKKSFLCKTHFHDITFSFTETEELRTEIGNSCKKYFIARKET